MSRFQRALAAGVHGAATSYVDQQKEQRILRTDQVKKDAEYERKENFARFGKTLSREEQVIGQTGQGINVYAGEALKKDYQEPEGFRSTEEMQEEKMESGMYYQGKKLTNKEYAALDPKARKETKTSEEYATWKAGLNKRDYRTATDSRFEKIDAMVAANEMTKAEGIDAKKAAVGAVPKKKGYEKQAAKFTKALADNDFTGLDKYAQDELVAQTYNLTAVADPAYAAELKKDKTMRTLLTNVTIAEDLVEKANASFNGDLDKAAAAYLEEKGGGKQAKKMIDAAKKWANGRYKKDEDKGWWLRDDSTFRMEKK